ncbi:MAG: hypothetical protein MJZ02_07555 [Paludibacteraceae bacterium]|nr:hypothetical protein [Paludibacteraceae bacterium]
MKKLFLLISMALMAAASIAANQTLIVFYSYTNHCKQISETLTSKIDADVVEITPAEKGLDYAANNYKIGSALIGAIKEAPQSASSYPEIDPVDVKLDLYNNIIIVAPLWWSQMAAPMQTFLFNYGSQMADKNIGLIVSSHSSGISGVETDCKRLIPNGKYYKKSLWINNSAFSNRSALLEQWLTDIDFKSTTKEEKTMFISINGKTLPCKLEDNSSTTALLEKLAEGEVTYEAHDYGNFEKVGELGFSLPTNNEQITTQPGDVILYSGNNLCIYYDENEWSFTRIGKIKDISKSELMSFLEAGEGNVKVTLSLSSQTGFKNISANQTVPTEKMFSANGQQLSIPPNNGMYMENGVKKMVKK